MVIKFRLWITSFNKKPQKTFSKTRAQLIDFDRSYNAVTLNGKTTQKQT